MLSLHFRMPCGSLQNPKWVSLMESSEVERKAQWNPRLLDNGWHGFSHTLYAENKTDVERRIQSVEEEASGWGHIS